MRDGRGRAGTHQSTRSRESVADRDGIAGIDPALIIDAAFRRANVGMAITDEAGHFLEVNDAFCAFLDRSPEELSTLSFQDVTAPEDLVNSATRMRSVAEGTTSGFSIDKRYVTATGEHVWARTTVVAVRDNDGELLRVIAQIEDLTTRHAIEAALARRGSYDDLTGLANRQLFHQRLDDALRLPQRHVQNMALLVVNLDRFHQVNAGLGHLAGDLVLREASARLTALVRGGDLVARLGGDEFALLTYAMRTPMDAVALAVELRRGLARPYWIDGNAVYVSARLGVVASFEDADGETLVQQAAAAAEQAKTLAGGWALHIPGADAPMRDELGLVSDLRRAIADGTVTVAYQPVVDRDGHLRHCEALARWTHPERGAVPPEQFVVLAEQNGLIGALTTHVMTLAAQQTAQWRADGIPVSVAVNLSGTLLATPGLADRIELILAEAGLPAEALTLEITETALADGSNPAILAALDALRTTGIRISIDDFGTGYSSLTYLRQLPVDELKIDRSFILDLDIDTRTERIVRSIIDLAHSLGLTVVAEGVEDEAVRARLLTMGIDYVQGFTIARPAPAQLIVDWLAEHATPTAPVRPLLDDPRGLDILVVDNEAASRTALRARLKQSSHRVTLAHSGAAALAKLKKHMPDVIILNLAVPTPSGVETVARMRDAGYAGPILLFSGSAPDELAATRFPLDVWPVSAADEALLIRLIDGYAQTATVPSAVDAAMAVARR